MFEFEFKRERMNCNYTMQENQLYVQYGLECPCNCCFCHNKVRTADCKSVCLEEVDKTVLQYCSDCKRIVFGGGEPLLHFDEISALVKRMREKSIIDSEYPCEEPVDSGVKVHIVTNGNRKLYKRHLYAEQNVSTKNIVGILLGEYDAKIASSSEKCEKCQVFDKIILSRHHYEDSKNSKIFGATEELLTTEDLRGLCSMQKQKIMLYCVCQIGGIDNREEIFNYLYWAVELGYTNILFSDLDIHNTPRSIYSNKNTEDNLFNSVISTLAMWHKSKYGSHIPHVVYNSSGYETTTLNIPRDMFLNHKQRIINDDDTIAISFKRYMDIPAGNKRFCNYVNEGIVHADGTI